jgi:5-methylcytosine-specific restriction endonuclease McrA
MLFFDEAPSRRNFTITTKRIEWMSAAGKDVMQYIRDKKFVKTSYCRECGTKLIWGDGRYNFDHKDNNPRNNSQKNCYLVCRNCHGKATKFGKRAIREPFFGAIVGYRTIKKKVGYKKPKKKGSRGGRGK